MIFRFSGRHESEFILGMLPPTDLDGLSHADLKSLVLKLLEEVAELRRTVAAQRDEIARLKGGSGRPNIKPSGMDKATEPKPPPTAAGEPRATGSKTSRLSIHEERTVKLTAPPRGSRFKGYTSFVPMTSLRLGPAHSRRYSSGATFQDPSPDHASRCTFLHVRRGGVHRRSVRRDRRKATRDAARSGLICHVGGSSGHTAPRLMGRTA